MEIFSGNINTLERALNYSSLKHKLTAQNIANADVPNYKAKGISFKKELADASARTIHSYRSDPRHFDFQIENRSFSIYNKKNMQYQHNGNNVDIDKEMTDLASNQIYYNALIERLNGKFSTLQNVIKGGR
ncbi:flagellar basal body rod protein FlgB [Lederbergia citrea]|uniref:Flagellar basal body rod protein FlgB n=1 Tax=Lederbergia citrea TaxID=2833581 RepID=A0A942Z2M4_9BACI|nr:flagellar basal body rod protein FlgB [Lederbergia citrea]MBS4177128.1 flagellar basal body rod protein FlgB [Lederbergia citrea]MBS4203791.1 flagellar basal body rod protein FlgB [Lederbergia citrea]MBS4221624.1 flagellar basal body rod protein FlgB [Lederbergia citrea]